MSPESRFASSRRAPSSRGALRGALLAAAVACVAACSASGISAAAPAARLPLALAPAGPAPATAPQVLLLGEVHDNPAGHRARLARLQALIDSGARPAIAMEQFDRERQPELDRALHDCADADCVVERAAPARAGWQWPLYRPVLELALRHRLPVLAANVSRQDAGRIAQQGYAAALDAGTIATYGLDRPAPAALVQVQRDEIAQGHCGMLPEAALDGMVRAQIARDVWMARTLAAQAGAAPVVVLLAGNGHVRKDVGVARWLAPADRARARSVGFVEHVPAAGEFDEVHRIPAHPRGDPCEAFRKPPQQPGR